MKNYSANKQRGMTLIELTVVLLILIGLAGLLLPYVSGFFKKTETSSSADSLTEVNKAIDRYETQFLAYPDGFDTLTNSTGVVNWIAGVGNTNVVNANLETFATTSGALDSLKAAEIDSLYQMNEGDPVTNDFNATFAGTSTGKTDIVVGSQLARIKPTSLATVVAQNMGIEVDSDDLADATAENDYLVFGVGQKTQMTGKTLKEAPVYFGGGVDNPTARYGRFLAVFKVPRDGSAATFVGALTPGLKAQSALIQDFHASIKDDD